MRAMRDHTFSRAEIDEALGLLGMPDLGHELCPIEETPVHEFDGGRPWETALTIVADDLREAVALAMQLAALVGDPEAVADLHTRMSFGLDRHGRQRYQFRGYHVEPASASAPVAAAEPSPDGEVRATPGRPSTPPCAVPLPDQSRPLILTEL